MTNVNSRSAEQSVIGSLFRNNNNWEVIANKLNTEDFHLYDHRLIFSAIKTLESRNDPFDAITVSEFLKIDNNLEKAGGQIYLGRLTKDVPSDSNISAYADIVRNYSINQQLTNTATQIIDIASGSSNSSSNIDQAQSLIFAIGQQYQKNSDGPLLLSDTIPDVLDDLEERRINDGPIFGIPTGFNNLDKKTAGLHAGDLNIIAGRPSMGKTTLAMNIAEYAALNGTGVLVFSLEMSRKQLTERQIATLANINFQKFRSADLTETEWARITATTVKLNNAPLYVDDSPSLTIGEIRSRARRLTRTHEVGLIIVDYLQLMKGNGANRNLEVTEISQGLKALAKEMDIPVIALSQLNRSLESRQDKRPTMSDLRDSGAIEQDADLIAFIYRDEVYHPETEHKGIAELIIRKQRNGPTGTVHLSFNGEQLRFSDFVGTVPKNNTTKPLSQKWSGGFDPSSVNN